MDYESFNRDFDEELNRNFGEELWRFQKPYLNTKSMIKMEPMRKMGFYESWMIIRPSMEFEN